MRDEWPVTKPASLAHDMNLKVPTERNNRSELV
jgi:hypothetical protein